MRHDLAVKLAQTERARFLVEGLDLPTATDIPGAEWEPFQLAHLNDDGLLRIETKSRQVGWSWTIAAEAVAVTHLTPRATYLFVSINREESAEKIRYARQVYDAMYPSWRKRLVSDNVLGLIFEDGSRILSLPQRPVRGKAKAWLGLDEYAHYRLDREIYTAALPVTTKGGRIRIGSTVLGARGMFWEIDQQKTRPYPGYTRALSPWWTVGALLKDEWRYKLREVSQEAPLLATDQRVLKFANQRILDIFLNLPLEDFQQEYEGVYVDESVAYIAWADILAAVMPETDRYRRWLTKTPDDAFSAVDELADAVSQRKITGQLTWGLDVGRKRDLTELVVLELGADGTRVVRAILSLDRQPFMVQEALCRRLLDHVSVIRRGYMDQNGLGMQLSENLHVRDGYAERAMPMPFTMQSKAQMAQHLKTRFQRRGQGQIRIPDDRALKYQIHSVRRVVTAASNVIFDVESSERHHADKFWALALANEAAEVLEKVGSLPSAPSALLRLTRNVNAVGEPIDTSDDPEDFGLTQDELRELLTDGISWPASLSLFFPGMTLPEQIVDATPPPTVDAAAFDDDTLYDDDSDDETESESPHDHDASTAAI